MEPEKNLHRAHIPLHTKKPYAGGLWGVLCLLILASLLVLSACQTPSDITEDTSTTGERISGVEEPVSDTEPTAPSTEEPATDVPPVQLPTQPVDTELSTDPSSPLHPDRPGDASAYQGLMIAMVYGTGKKNTDASASHGFVQLYNASDSAMSLAGASLYYKSDGAKPYQQLAFPENATIPAHGYYLVRANSPEGYDASMAILSVEAYDLAWDIYLDNKEVRLVLAPSGWAIASDQDILDLEDAISVFYASETYVYSVMATNKLSKDRVAVRTALTPYSGYHTVKLSETATAELERLRPITSDGRVNPLVGSRLKEVFFSHPAGIYDASFSLELSAAQGYTIYYTLDGSDPTTSHTRKPYRDVIAMEDSSSMAWGPTIKAWINGNGNSRPASARLPGGYVVKAYATNGSEATEVFTNTYFVTSQLSDYGVSVVSLSIPVSDMLGAHGFYSNYCPTGVITDTRPRGLAMMEVFDPNGQRVGHSQVELAVSGNGSSGWAMKSLRIYYKGSNNQGGGLESDLDYDLFGGRVRNSRGEAITSFSRLLLRNSGNDCHTSYIRDAYMQSTCTGLSVDTMASASTLVFVNGEFWGVYNIRERYSPEYVEAHYGIQKENVALVESDYSQVHTNQNAPYVLSSGVEGDQDPFNEMVDYIRSHDMSTAEAYQWVCDRMDMDSFIDMWVSRLFYVARDWPENNIKVWRNKNPDDPSGQDTKWHFTLLDLDMGLSFYDFTMEDHDFFWAINANSVCGTMMVRLIQNSSFRQQFILRYHELVNDHFTPAYLSQVFERLYQERTPLMTLQVQRWGNEGSSLDAWNRAASLIRAFIEKRQAYALTYMYRYFGLTAGEIDQLSGKRAALSFQADRVEVTVNGETVTHGQVLKFQENTARFTVQATARSGYVITAISWVGNDGHVKTVEASGETAKANFSVSTSGTITVYTKRTSALGPQEQGGSLTAGANYLFFLSQGGDLYAWGSNQGGILGLDPATAVYTFPTLVRSDVRKVSTTTSSDFENGNTAWMTAILTTDGQLYTVGANASGQLGRHGTSADNQLGLVPFDGVVTDISVGHDHLLVLDDQGVLWGVGNNAYGQLGSRAGGSTQTFVKIAEHVVSFSAGRRSTLFIDQNGNLYGLGDNRWNKMVAGGPDHLTTPTLLMKQVAFITSGEHEALAVTRDGTLYYAGWRDFSSFGQGPGNTPAFCRVMDQVESASIYFGDMVIQTKNGDAYVYGINTGNAIDGAVTGGTPKKLCSGVRAVAAGYGFTAYLTQDGRVLVQGDNTYGQAGQGQTGTTIHMAEVDL